MMAYPKPYIPKGLDRNEWANGPAYIGRGVEEGTLGESINHFFYEILTPWVEAHGYSWQGAVGTVAKRFRDMIYCLDDIRYRNSVYGTKYHMKMPSALHRDFPEDRETFDHVVSHVDFAEFCARECDTLHILGLPEDSNILEFCYLHVNVEAGAPGRRTAAYLDALAEHSDDDDTGGKAGNAALPDGYMNRRKNDLY